MGRTAGSKVEGKQRTGGRGESGGNGWLANRDRDKEGERAGFVPSALPSAREKRWLNVCLCDLVFCLLFFFLNIIMANETNTHTTKHLFSVSCTRENGV